MLIKFAIQMEDEMNKINVGCGDDYKEGWINLDYEKECNPDIFFNLNRIYSGVRLPYKDNSFDKILIKDVLEHLPEPLPILRELYRICKVGGEIEIKVPCGKWVWDNMDHKRRFNYHSFDTNSFKFNNYPQEEVRLIHKSLYLLPSSNPLFKLARILFFKMNIRVVYRKIK